MLLQAFACMLDVKELPWKEKVVHRCFISAGTSAPEHAGADGAMANAMGSSGMERTQFRRMLQRNEQQGLPALEPMPASRGLYDGEFGDTLQDALDIFGATDASHAFFDGHDDMLSSETFDKPTSCRWAAAEAAAHATSSPFQERSAASWEPSWRSDPLHRSVSAPYLSLSDRCLQPSGLMRSAGDDGILPGATDIELLDADGMIGCCSLRGSRHSDSLPHLLPWDGGSSHAHVRVDHYSAQQPMSPPARSTPSPGTSNSYKSLASAPSMQSLLSSDGMDVFTLPVECSRGQLTGGPMQADASLMCFRNTAHLDGASGITSAMRLPQGPVRLDKLQGGCDDGSEGSEGSHEQRLCGGDLRAGADDCGLNALADGRRVTSRTRRPTAARAALFLNPDAVGAVGKKRGSSGNQAGVTIPNPNGIACTSCGAKVTPVWRAGPQGPKTLCNACGVRYMKVAKKK